MDRLSAFLCQFPLVPTAFNVNSQLTTGQKQSLSCLHPPLRVCFKCFIWYVVYFISFGTLCDPSQFGWVLWRWAWCVNQSDSETRAWSGQKVIKGVKRHPHGTCLGHRTQLLQVWMPYVFMHVSYIYIHVNSPGRVLTFLLIDVPTHRKLRLQQCPSMKIQVVQVQPCKINVTVMIRNGWYHSLCIF